MLQNNDLDAAIGAGILTQRQADDLLAFAAERRNGTAALRADEERFRFMRGFNDFFFAVGIVLLGSGLALFAGIFGSNFVLFGGITSRHIIYAAAAVIMWVLAEQLVRRWRLVLPGIVIAIFFVMFAAFALPLADLFGDMKLFDIGPNTPTLEGSFITQLSIRAAIVSTAAALFYIRFRFPFALLLMATGAAMAINLASAQLFGSITASLLIMMACGLAAFSIAMWFDLSDRLRATRRSDCAFWLHVAAAPLLVNSLIGLVSGDLSNLDNFDASMIVIITLALTVIALIIDRRALLVSALIYVGIVIAFALSGATADHSLILIATLIILGTLVLALGIGWAPLRRRITSLISPRVMDRLPPVVPA